MIDGTYVKMMSRYCVWQNAAHLSAMAALSDDALEAERGGFFGSLFKTANHLLWADRIWLSRFAGTPKPVQPSITLSIEETVDRAAFEVARREVDAAILAWGEQVTDADLVCDLTWFSGALGREVTKPTALCVMHFFNHQTHHRGQMHAMLTAAGVKTEDTDLFVMPGV